MAAILASGCHDQKSEAAAADAVFSLAGLAAEAFAPDPFPPVGGGVGRGGFGFYGVPQNWV